MADWEDFADRFQYLFIEWQRSAHPAFLNQAIDWGTRTLAEPDVDPEARVIFTANLCMAFTSRFKLTRERSDIDEAVRLGLAALDRAGAVELDGAGPGAFRARAASNVAASLGDRYEAYADRADLDRAITLLEDSLANTPGADPNRPGRLVNLANMLALRSQAGGDRADIDTAITCCRQVVDGTSAADPRLAQRMKNLSRMHFLRAESSAGPAEDAKSQASEDVDAAVRWARQALAANATAPVSSSGDLSDWAALVLVHRYSLKADRGETGDIGDLEGAIKLQADAIAAPNTAPVTRLGARVRMARALLYRYKRLQIAADLTRAQAELTDVCGDPAADPAVRESCDELLRYISRLRVSESTAPEDYAAALAAARQASEASRMSEAHGG